jgi:cytochrome c553
VRPQARAPRLYFDVVFETVYLFALRICPTMKPLLSLALTLLISGAALATASTSAVAQDAKAGEKKAQLCIGCHGIVGYQASFPEVHKVPMIAGQGAGYIVSALTAYKKGERLHPTMRGVAATLSEQDMADLAAFYESQAQGSAPAPAAVGEPPARVAELMKKANCASCHGANYSKPVAPNYPKIAGQHPDYLYVALKAYQTDRNPQVGRKNGIMGGMARQYTHAELKELAAYIGSLPGELHTVPQSRFR